MNASAKKDAEREVANAFVASLKLSKYTVMTDVDEPAADVRLACDDGDIYLQLVEYRSELAKSQQEHRRDKFFELVNKKLGKKSGPPWIRIFAFLRENVQDGLSNKCVPGDIAEELHRIAKSHPVGPTQSGRVLQIAGASVTSPLETEQITEESYPQVCRHFRKLRLTEQSFDLHTIRFANAHWIDVDHDSITKIIRDKSSKIPQYRECLGDNPLWLVIHSDGGQMSSRLPDRLFADALSCARQEIKKAADATPSNVFDRVYWLRMSCPLAVRVDVDDDPSCPQT